MRAIMTESQYLTWQCIAEKFLVPLSLGAVSLFIGYGANEISSMRKDLQTMQIEIAKLQVEMKLYRESKD
jgi:hypothetical protein